MFIVCLVTLAAGCLKGSNSSQSASSQVATNSNASPVPLPGDWPVPELTLPPGAMLVSSVLNPPDADYKDKVGIWLAHIDYSQGWDALGDHVESCLKPLNYGELWMDNPQFKQRDMQRWFFSPDQLTQVNLGNSEGVPDLPGTGDYTITIVLWTTPFQGLGLAGTTSPNGTKTYLEPIK